ncbi:MAG: HlyD family efflux transporter periplasmic adaptor subunit [Anaerolineales bacterium]|nr:MAG: HlyD family efflux transporter periplasmic adaptor subunit [Anaerolineales bacterium]
MRILKKSLALTFMVFIVLTAGACDAINSESGNQLSASGIVEAREIAIASELGGRVMSIHVEEGDSVGEDEVLLILDDSMLLVQRDQAVAAVESAQAALESAQAGEVSASAILEAAHAQVEMAMIQVEMELARARAEYWSERVGGWSGTQPDLFNLPEWYFEKGEEITAAHLVMESAEQSLTKERSQLQEMLEEVGGKALLEAEDQLAEARAEFQIADELWKRLATGDEGQDIRDRIREIHDQAIDDLNDAQDAFDDLLTKEEAEDLLEARSNLTVAQEHYQVAQEYYQSLLKGEYDLRVQAAQLALVQAEAGAAQGEAALTQTMSLIQSAEHAVNQAKAMLALVEIQLEKMTIRAPESGVVLTRSVESGEVLAPGLAALTIGDLDELYITVYVPEDRYGEIQLGDKAQVSVDSFPDETFDAIVVRIADRAEFTPRNVQTEEDRRTTVYAVELMVEKSLGKLKPGMPADVVFELAD